MLVETKRSLSRFFPQPLLRAVRRGAWEVAHPWCTLDSGVKVEIVSINQWILFTDIFVRGEYDPAIDRAIETSGSHFIGIDLGANIGFFSLRLADRVLTTRGPAAAFTVYSVEGATREFRQLERRVEQPAVRGKVRPIHGLVGNRSGRGIISRGHEHTNEVVESGDGDAVAYVDLEELLPPDCEIDLLKCDIEGSEEPFIENYGALLRRVRVAVFELHGDRCDVGRCERLLSEAGFAQGRTTTVNGHCRVVVFTR
jgi:FkbM family methyltransferase